MTLNIQLVNDIYVIGSNLSRDGLVEGGTSETSIITIPSLDPTTNNTITQIGAYAFEQYMYIQEVIVSPFIEYFNQFSFHGCQNLRRINIPMATKYIFANVFDDCFALKLISFESPSSLIGIGWGVFNTCKSLEEIILPPTLKELDQFTFSEIPHLTVYYSGSYNFHNYIGKYVFYQVDNFTIYVPLNGPSRFCEYKTAKTHVLPLIPNASCPNKERIVGRMIHCITNFFIIGK